ncbi:MAG TPA: DUF1015 family protein [Saprospiraceae bacterium]|nr:DUF1015 domain-containing protein [Saprospiraceae bacterium]MCB9329384.1 DUF1015 domain-containing protein [Lewinellaceae bacterium]HPK08827.1 DUF1015 family protein [Saprospiraceae bacterium]HPQ21269.1 DUF1015 family protein [Saprospiraceae bacterium]HRX28827.1 DUF1015 family protein [Saprospiraceae bacterium]
MKIVPFKAVYPNVNLVTSPDSFFGTVKEDYKTYLKSGFFKKDEDDSIFVYRITEHDKTHIGIVACNDIRDIQENRILRHENTLASKEQSMMQLMLDKNAMVKPVLLAYEEVPELTSFMKTVVQSKARFLDIYFEQTNEHHELWKVSDEESIAFVKQCFSNNVKKTYIADGHHRCYTTLHLYENKDYPRKHEDIKSILAIYFPFQQLSIYDFNRIASLPPKMSPVEFIVRLSKFFSIRKLNKLEKPRRKFEMTLCIRNEFFRIKWKKKVLNKYASDTVILDANMLNVEVFQNILDIQDVKTDSQVKYLAGNTDQEEVLNILSKNENRIGFFLFPISADELKKVADAGETLPPKSTWFEPRIKNGILVKEI